MKLGKSFYYGVDRHSADTTAPAILEGLRRWQFEVPNTLSQPREAVEVTAPWDVLTGGGDAPASEGPHLDMRREITVKKNK